MLYRSMSYKGIVQSLRKNTECMNVHLRINTNWYKKITTNDLVKVMNADIRNSSTCQHKVTLYAIPKNKIVGVFVPSNMLVSRETIHHISEACKDNYVIIL